MKFTCSRLKSTPQLLYCQLAVVPLIFAQLLSLSSSAIVADQLLSQDGSDLLASCATTSTRIDCHPEPAPNEQECARRNCCWLGSINQNNISTDNREFQNLPLVQQPNCFFPSTFHCYQVIPWQEQEDNNLPSSSSYTNKDTTTHSKGDAEDADSDGTTIDDKEHSRDSSDSNSGGSDSDNDKDGSAQPVNARRWLLIRSNKCPASGFADDAERLVLELGVYGESLINIKISELDKRRFVPSLPEIKLPINRNNYNYYYNHNNEQQNNRAAAKWKQSSAQDADDKASHVNSKNTNSNNNNAQRQVFGQPETPTTQRFSLNRLIAIELQAPVSVKGGEDENNAAGVLKVIHQISNAILFEADLGKLIYSRQFIQLPTYLPPSSLVYGFGQHMGESLLKSSGGDYAKSYTMFNYGHPPKADGRSAYSSYPFYINLAQLSYDQDAGNDNDSQPGSASKSASHNVSANSRELKRELIATGGFMLNTGPMDVLLHSNNGQRTGITWRLISGIVDLYLFAGPKPHDVIGQFQSLVGSPSVPPAWSLGYHQSRHNYMSLMPIKMAWAKTRSAGIPMESVWTDIDFLRRGTSYTVNEPYLNELIKTLQDSYGMHYVPIVDPAISVKEEIGSYKPLDLAREMDMFAKNSDQSIPIVSSWTDSKESALLDFTHPQIVEYLEQVLGDYRKQLNYDGLWLDMNEPEVFANVADDNGQVCAQDEQPKYLPAARSLHDKTLCMAAEFRSGKHQDLHNLYAFYQSKAHYETLKLTDPTKRPFLLSRAQFAGQGKYSGTWLGDMASTFEHMHWSVLGMIESNWFGQPLVGADICGFFGSTTDELCARWFSLGAFYPFSRNHNHGSARDQDPGSLSETVQLAARLALMRRYSLLPYLYTLFYDNHLKNLPVVRSVLFESFDLFLTNYKLTDLPQIDDQFMWGSAIMVAPVLKLGSESRRVYLPPGRWYDISIGIPGTNMKEGIYDALESNWPSREQAEITDARVLRRNANLRRSIDCESGFGCWMDNVFTPVGSINIYLKAGQIIPTFRQLDHENSVSMNWKNAAFFLEAALDTDRGAFGSLFWDSGESEVGDGSNHQAIFWIQDDRLVISAIEDGHDEPLQFDGFLVYGVVLSKSLPEATLVQGARLVYKYDRYTESLSCLFRSPSNLTQSKPLSIKKFERLEFKW